MAKPMKVREFSTRPIWQDDTWLQKHAGETLGVGKDKDDAGDDKDGEGGDKDGKEKSDTDVIYCIFIIIYSEYYLKNIGHFYRQRQSLHLDLLLELLKILKFIWILKLGNLQLVECHFFFELILFQ
jgi:hypothetical protein